VDSSPRQYSAFGLDLSLSRTEAVVNWNDSCAFQDYYGPLAVVAVVVAAAVVAAASVSYADVAEVALVGAGHVVQ
jgi:hypothetical protein